MLNTWSGDGGWGDLSDQTISVSLTGIQITSSIGIEGWGNNTYDQGAWGEFATPIGLESTFSLVV